LFVAWHVAFESRFLDYTYIILDTWGSVTKGANHQIYGIPEYVYDRIDRWSFLEIRISRTIQDSGVHNPIFKPPGPPLAQTSRSGP
jgi:hypothetical protein